MSFRDQLRQQTAAIARETLKQTVGVTLKYYHEQRDGSSDWIEIICYPDDTFTQTRNQFATQRTNVRRRILMIPKMTTPSGAFPPDDGIANGDEFIDEEKEERWRVVEHESDALGAIFYVTVERVTFKSTLPQEQ